MKRTKIAIIIAVSIVSLICIFLFINFSGDKPEKKNEIERVTVAVNDSETTESNIETSVTNTTQNETKANSYEMNPITTEYLKNLDKQVDFYFLMEMETLKNASDANETSDLISLLEQYKEYEKINFIDFDINENPDIITKLDPDNYLNLQEGDIVIKCDDLIKRVPASEMYYNYGSYDVNGNFTENSQTFQGENLITGAIKSVVENISPTVYFLIGHGEKSLENDYTRFKANLRNSNYEVKELDLAASNVVPDDAAIIIFAAPKEDISDSDKEKLDKYLDKGGNISLLMSPQNNDTIYKNITEIMNEYCLDMGYSRAYETDDSKCLSGDKYYIETQLVDISESDESLTDLTSSIIEEANPDISYMPPSRTFEAYKDDNNTNINICPLLESYNTAKAESYGGAESENNILADVNTPLWLSAYSEDTARNNSKLVVMGNAEFIDDEYLSEGYAIVPLYLYLTTIAWMHDSNIDMGIPPKEIN